METMNEWMSPVEKIAASISMLNRSTPGVMGKYEFEARNEWVSLIIDGPKGRDSVGSWPIANAVLAIEAWAWSAVLMNSHVKSWQK